MTTPRLLIPEILENQASKYITHNEALRVVDALVQTVVEQTLNTPPASPTNGQCWIVGSSPTGAYVGNANKIAQWYNTTWYFYTALSGWSVFNKAVGYRLRFDGTNWVAENQQSYILVASDEITALTTGTSKITFRVPHAMVLTDVRASLSTAQSTGTILTVDINEDGTSILSTKLTIDNTEKTSKTAATPVVISDSALADDAEITLDIDQVGDGTAKGLKVYLTGVRL